VLHEYLIHYNGHAQVRNLGFPGAEELGNMFHYYTDFPESYNGLRDLEVARALNPNWLSLTEFLNQHRDQLTA
jgi:hypothetical protein